MAASKKSSAAPPPKAAASAKSSGPRKSRILIADDNAPNCELLEAFLADVECEIAMAVDGRDTLDKVATFQPDLILLDVMMPKLSGFEVCKELKSDRRDARDHDPDGHRAQ